MVICGAACRGARLARAPLLLTCPTSSEHVRTLQRHTHDHTKVTQIQFKSIRVHARPRLFSGGRRWSLDRRKRTEGRLYATDTLSFNPPPLSSFNASSDGGAAG